METLHLLPSGAGHTNIQGFLPSGFDNASLTKSVQERSTPNPVTLNVIRRFGVRGGSRVRWEARLDGVLASDDVDPVQGDLVFAQGETSKTINFNVQPDATPEILEVSDHLKVECLIFYTAYFDYGENRGSFIRRGM